MPPLSVQVYSPPKKDLSWMGLPEFVDDTVTDYTRPTPSIDVSKGVNGELEGNNTSVDKGETWPRVNYSQDNMKFTSTHKSMTPRAVLLKSGTKPIAVNKPSSTPKSTLNGIPQDDIDDKGYWDSGCSRYMTSNISYMSEYEPYNEGYVSFGHGGGKITSKGTIKTDKLEFENVYFVKELKYNLFSVSQICDNKNSVLFTDLECLVLGKDFKLYNDSHVWLRTPRQQNMYSIDLKNIVPHTNMTCLNAKASENESIKKEFSNDGTPQQNGVAERRNRTLIEAARTMLADAKLPVTFWAKAVSTACYVQNRVLVNKSQNKTPYELFNGTKEVASQAMEENMSTLRFIALPNWNVDVFERSRNTIPTSTTKDPTADQVEPVLSSIVETEVPTVSSHVPTDKAPSLGNAMTFENRLEDIFGDSTASVKLNEVEADLRNIETNIQVNPIPTL
ncbi:ribonuclease H-like domain-containing protein [Tanacetum coccineum]|uniref:Ribonuclease H-like domain-containing protein n=1 Tax=Tanacetum coccineum TaxID=301880 RepID=A0ABQ5H6J0_9ASTR